MDSCKRRYPRDNDVPLCKWRKVSLGAQQCDTPPNEEVTYQALVSAEEDLSPSLLASKIKTLKTVLNKAEHISEALSTGKLTPAAEAELTDIEARELTEALQSAPHSQFGVSKLLTKDAQSLASGTWVIDEIVNEYAGLLTRESNLAVGSSFIFELLRDMRAAKIYDAEKMEQALETCGVSSECSQLALPICWNSCHWSCALICQSTERIVHYDTHGDANQLEAFELLQWFVHNTFLSLSPFAEVGKSLPPCTAEDSGPAMLYALRCLSTGRRIHWAQTDLPSLRRLLSLETKRASLLSTKS